MNETFSAWDFLLSSLAITVVITLGLIVVLWTVDYLLSIGERAEQLERDREQARFARYLDEEREWKRLREQGGDDG